MNKIAEYKYFSLSLLKKNIEKTFVNGVINHDFIMNVQYRQNITISQ